jgi:hypothetical protein
MAIRRRSVRVRVALLVLVPLAFLIAIFGYTVATSASSVLTLSRSKVMMDTLARPTADLQQAIRAERAQVIVYYAQPTPARLASLARLQADTNRALTAFRVAAGSPSVRQSASPTGRRAINALIAGSAQLTGLRAGIPARTASAGRLFAAYNAALAASYQVLEQAVIQEGDSSQVLPGVAVIELAVSDEYLQQESALLNGDFAASAFPVRDQKTFASLVGAHRMLYAQSLPYLTQADRASLRRDLEPRVAARLTALENAITAHASPLHLMPVGQAAWNATAGTYTSQIQRAVSQAEARLAAGARSQADAKLRTLYLAGGLGLTAVAVSVVFSLWVAAGLTRQLTGLRDSALELAHVHLPAVVRRLRAGEEVDAEAEVPPLDTEADEIGQVNAAFNAARRTAVEAAVDEARLRRGISDVFRNLAKRNQSLLHRQMALLDVLERREEDPGNLDSLYRIDHLTTRMRRHAESLVVLAGDTPKRGWRHPVPFVDVLRAAASEVEDYTRIKVITSTRAALAGPVVADVIHMIAELAENATVYSPRDNQVRIVGEMVANGFAIEIEDRGLGLDDRELAMLNSRLADPPLFDLSGSDQLGIFVAAQLAKRHGITASLTRSPYGGVTAVALIPMSLVVDPDAPGRDEDGVPLVPGDRHALAAPDVAAAGPGGPRAAIGRPVALVPASAGRRAGMAGAPVAADPPPAAVQAAPLPPDGPGMTENGLPIRVRRASLAPQLRETGIPGPAAGGGHAARDPEVVRAVMSAFHHGWRQGLADPGEAPAPAQGGAQEQ